MANKDIMCFLEYYADRASVVSGSLRTPTNQWQNFYQEPQTLSVDSEVGGSYQYLAFDVDGFDLSIMPATGTPEPGGLLWDETLNIIKIAAKNSNIVGADINELSPIKGFNSYNFLVAKLAYKILSYKFLY